MGRWMGWLAVVAASGAAACLDRSAVVCDDGRVCARGTVCVVALDLCADPGQLAACDGLADGADCHADGIPTGACSAGVCLASGCGNGVVEAGEACDDGNTSADDGCSADCLSNEECGNGFKDPDELCDCGVAGGVNPDCGTYPNGAPGGVCRADCTPFCGDMVVQENEECDPGLLTPVSCASAVFDRGTTTCSPLCKADLSNLDTCRYIGFRTRVNPHDAIDIALTGAGRGFFVASDGAGFSDDYMRDPDKDGPWPSPLTGVWAAGDDSAVAVGDGGTILRWDGAAWAQQESGTTERLRDVWGRATHDVYAVGDAGTVLHWDGVSWSSLAPPVALSLRAVAGDAERVYVAGDAGTLLVLDSSGWQIADAGTGSDLQGVWSAGGFVVAVGTGGTIVQNDGGGWVPGRTAATVDLHSVWGSVEDGFFAAGDAGTILFFDGRVWRPLSLGRGVQGSASQSFFVVTGIPGEQWGAIGTEDIISYEGAAWSPTARPSAESLHALWGSGPDDVFAVGRRGTILHHDGLGWTKQDSGVSVDLHGVGGTGPDDVYAVGDDLTLLRYDGAAWTTVRTGPLGDLAGALLGVFLAAPGDLVAVGEDGIFRSDGGDLALDDAGMARAVWGADARNVWAVGDLIRFFDGTDWAIQEVAVSDSFTGVSGSAVDDVYAVGPTVIDWRWNGVFWRPGPFADTDLTAVSASADLGVFAAGRGGKLRHWDRDALLEPLVSRTTTDLRALFVSGHVVFMAGDDGALDVMVFHY